jgi:hypothetical protein
MKKSYKWVNLFVQGIVILAVGVGASVSWASPGIDEDSASCIFAFRSQFLNEFDRKLDAESIPCS